MSKHLRKVENIVVNALMERGFSPGEADLIVEKLSVAQKPTTQPAAKGPTESVRSESRFGSTPSRSTYSRTGGKSFSTVRMAFGKYRGWELRDIKTNYLVWIANKDWFEVKFTTLYNDIQNELNERRKRGTL